METKSNELQDTTFAGKIDALEATLATLPQVEMEVVHRFTPGLYIREIHIPAGTMLTSAEHKTEHPFVLSKGRIIVTSDNEGRLIYEAPFTGVTMPGTRRALYAETDVIWTTFHVTSETDVEKIGEQILAPHQNPLISEGQSLLPQWQKTLPNS